MQRIFEKERRGVRPKAPVPPGLLWAGPPAMLFWALMASGQITMRRVDGWQTLDQAAVKQPIDLSA